MHPNPAFRASDKDRLIARLGEIAFTRIFLQTPSGPRVAHAPVLVAGPRAIRFHLANKNDLVRHLDGATALALGEGPNGYLSANWYDDVRGAVPTWNYEAIECEGRVRRLDRNGLVDLLDALAVTLEPRVGEDWTRVKMEPARFEAMLNAITAFEMTVEAVRGTRKLSQNQPEPVAEKLAARMELQSSAETARAMRWARQ